MSVMVAGMFSAATGSDLPLAGSVITLSLDLGPRIHDDWVVDGLDLPDATVYLAWPAGRWPASPWPASASTPGPVTR